MIPIHATLLRASDIFGPRKNNIRNLLMKEVKQKNIVFTEDGRNAISLALENAGMKGKEIIVPGYACRAVVDAVERQNKAIFVDVDPLTFNIDTKKIAQKITKNTGAIVAIHLFGNPCEIDRIKKITLKNNLLLIEDCAQSLLGTFKGKPLGSFGDYSIFSFRFSKDITSFKGGALLSNKSISGLQSSGNLLEPWKILSLVLSEKILGTIPAKTYKGIVSSIEDDFKEKRTSLSDFKLMLLEKQFLRLKEAIDKRREHAIQYRKNISNSHITHQKPTEGHTYYRYSMRTKNAEEIQKKLIKNGIFADRMYNYSISDEKESMLLAKEIINIPVHHKLKPQHVEHIIEVLNEVS